MASVADEPAPLPSVFEYLDYRAYLRDYFAAAKVQKKQFSFRYFARRAGFSSPNFVQLVMQGKRNLGRAAVDQVTKGLGLTLPESSFFGDLVALGQAETLAERNRAFSRVAANRRFRTARRLDGPLFEYLSQWYYPAVRELAARVDFVEDPAWIAAEVLPRITAVQARGALSTLEKLGLLVRDERGRLVRGDPTLTTGHEVRSVVVPAYHRQMIERAGAAVDTVPPDQRDVSALTVCIRASTLAELKERIHRFREEMLDRCDSETEPERVYQLCIQLFPLSQSPDERRAPGKTTASVRPPRVKG